MWPLKEIFGRYDKTGKQRPRPFARYLSKCDILSQYAMLRTLSQNDVPKRQNRTFKNMVRSMINHSSLPDSLLGETLWNS